MKRLGGGITRPKGFLAGGVHCGIKRNRKDLCLIFSQVPAKAAGVFTSNKVKAAPLTVSKRHLAKGVAQAIVANSGNANCMTGKAGFNDALSMAETAARVLEIRLNDVLVASTGIIGKTLPIAQIVSGIERLAPSLHPHGSQEVSAAIMTTDTTPKEIAVSFEIGAQQVTIGAVAKGAGMIHPNMATMLSFITTDANISRAGLQKALKESVECSFNAITVDGDTSTNDCVFILANGLACNELIKTSGKDYETFAKALSFVCSALAEMIIRDAEGATKFVKVFVKNAKSKRDAKLAAYAIATSQLVKTAINGEDPNWGRIAAAVGRSGADVTTDALDIYIGNKKVLSGGRPQHSEKSLLRAIFRKHDIEITVALNKGGHNAHLITSDLSRQYVAINAHYST